MDSRLSLESSKSWRSAKYQLFIFANVSRYGQPDRLKFPGSQLNLVQQSFREVPKSVCVGGVDRVRGDGGSLSVTVVDSRGIVAVVELTASDALEFRGVASSTEVAAPRSRVFWRSGGVTSFAADVFLEVGVDRAWIQRVGGDPIHGPAGGRTDGEEDDRSFDCP